MDKTRALLAAFGLKEQLEELTASRNMNLTTPAAFQSKIYEVWHDYRKQGGIATVRLIVNGGYRFGTGTLSNVIERSKKQHNGNMTNPYGNPFVFQHTILEERSGMMLDIACELSLVDHNGAAKGIVMFRADAPKKSRAEFTDSYINLPLLICRESNKQDKNISGNIHFVLRLRCTYPHGQVKTETYSSAEFRIKLHTSYKHKGKASDGEGESGPDIKEENDHRGTPIMFESSVEPAPVPDRPPHQPQTFATMATQHDMNMVDRQQKILRAAIEQHPILTTSNAFSSFSAPYDWNMDIEFPTNSRMIPDILTSTMLGEFNDASQNIAALPFNDSKITPPYSQQPFQQQSYQQQSFMQQPYASQPPRPVPEEQPPAAVTAPVSMEVVPARSTPKAQPVQQVPQARPAEASPAPPPQTGIDAKWIEEQIGYLFELYNGLHNEIAMNVIPRLSGIENQLKSMKDKPMNDSAYVDSFLSVAASEAHANNSPSPITSLKEFQILSTAFRDSKGRDYVAREWLFKAFDEWLTTPNVDTRGGKAFPKSLLMTGKLGLGKSSFVVQLIKRDFRANGAGRMLGYHFCQRTDQNSISSRTFVLNFAAMLEETLPQFREALNPHQRQELVELAELSKGRDPGHVLEHVILELLSKIPSSGTGVQDRNPNLPKYFIIDGIDECIGYKDNLLDVLLPRLGILSTYIRVVFTAVGDLTVFECMAGVPIYDIDSVSNQKNIKNDISEYTRRKLQKYMSGMLPPGPASREPLLPPHISDNIRQMCMIITEKSADVFEYAVTVCNELLSESKPDSRPVDVARLRDLPVGMEALYAHLFRSLPFGELRYLVQSLCVAREPLTTATLEELHPYKDSAAVRNHLHMMGRFLRISEQGGFSFFHKSFFDWITNPEREGQPSYVRLSEAEEVLATAGYSLFMKARQLAHVEDPERKSSLVAVLEAHPEWGYFRRQLHHHLYAAGKILECLEVLGEAAWMGSSSGVPPLHEICRWGFQNCIDVLVKRDPSCLLYEDEVNGETALHRAVWFGHERCVERLLDMANEFGTNMSQFVNVKSKRLRTPLHLGARQKHFACCKQLLLHGADPMIKDNKGKNAIHMAAVSGFSALMNVFANLLVQEQETPTTTVPATPQAQSSSLLADSAMSDNDGGADDADDEDDAMDTAIRHVPKFNMSPNVKMEMAYGRPRGQQPKQQQQKFNISFTVCDSNGNTPLHEAAARGFADCVDVLCRAVSIETKNRLSNPPTNDELARLLPYLDTKNLVGKTPLHLAAQFGRQDCFKGLLAWGLDINATDFTPKNDEVPFEPQNTRGKRELSDADLISKRSKYGGRTMLHIAVLHNQKDILEDILARKGAIDVNAQDLEGDTAAHYACQYNHPAMLTLLFGAGATIDMGNKQGRTPLIVAAREGNVKCMDICLAHGASLAPRTHRSGTVVHAAAGKGFKEALDALARHFPGINVNVMNAEGKTPLSLACERGFDQCVIVLLQMGANVDGQVVDQYIMATKKNLSAPLERKYLIEEDDAVDDAGDMQQDPQTPQLPIHAAVAHGHLRCLELLIENGAKVTLQRYDGRTALHEAGKNVNCIMRLLRALPDDATRLNEIIRPDRDGITPLHVYAARGYDQALHTLLSCMSDNSKINIYVRDHHGNTPGHMAAARGKSACLSVLRRYEMEYNPPLPDGATSASIPYVFSCMNANGDTPAQLASKHGHSDVSHSISRLFDEEHVDM